MSFTILSNSIKNLPIIVLLLIILGLSAYTVYELKNTQPNTQGTIESLKNTLDSHQELVKYQDQYPRITYITDAFLDLAKQNNLDFFENAEPGHYLLEYIEATVIYNPKTDSIVNIQEIELAPPDLIEKLTTNQELSAYKDIRPANIIIVNQENLESLKEQIAGLDASYLGDFILSYNDRIVIYDYDANQIKSNIALQQEPEQSQLPADFFQKLLTHPEMEGLESENPNGRQLDQATLDQLRGDFPTLYENSEVGDFVLQYTSKLIIYNYQNDVIKDAFDLQE